MKLAGYIFKLFLPLLLGALVLFCLAFEIVDLFMNMWKYLSNNVPVPVILKILYLYLPKTITFSLPLAILFATCYMLCILSSQNELVAMFASGISYIKAMLPLIIFSLLLSPCRQRCRVDSGAFRGGCQPLPCRRRRRKPRAAFAVW